MKRQTRHDRADESRGMERYEDAKRRDKKKYSQTSKDRLHEKEGMEKYEHNRTGKYHQTPLDKERERVAMKKYEEHRRAARRHEKVGMEKYWNRQDEVDHNDKSEGDLRSHVKRRNVIQNSRHHYKVHRLHHGDK